MSATHNLSLAEARQLALQAQGLGQPCPFGKGKAGTLRAIEHLGYVQIDTISAVERAHHHVLWTRVPGYKHAYLHDLQASERKIFEYWSHAAAFLPITDYRYCLPRMQALATGERHWFPRDRQTMQQVLERITVEGPLLTRDFETPPDKAGTWWEWKPAKRALERLFLEGRLMISERKGFQKVYDLTERVLPAGVDTTMPTLAEMARFLIRRALKAHGLVTAQEVSYQRSGILPHVRTALAELEDAGELIRLRVTELGALDFFALPEIVERAAVAPLADLYILSPFDNVVIQRKRLQRLFNFEYQIECYTPAAKRKFGYFTLPLLWQGRMIGRLDATADRRRRVLKVHSLHFEPGLRRSAALSTALDARLRQFAEFNSCAEILMPD